MLPVCRQNSESHHDRGRAQKIKGGDIAESPRFSGHTSETGQVHSSSLPRGSRRSVRHQLHIFASARPGDMAPLGNYDGKVMWQRAGSRGRTAHRLLRRTLEEKQEERFAKVAHQTRETWRRAGAAAGCRQSRARSFLPGDLSSAVDSLLSPANFGHSQYTEIKYE